MKTRLRVLRAEREWTQAELAEKAGLSRATINAYERGHYAPSLPNAFKIARLFDKSIAEVFIDDSAETVFTTFPDSGRTL